ncbi:PREDICTED: C-type lectin domain family 4 member M-like [Branchiostoma belcheri]|uniref:C-type lectin domain family 4 member M-like n=1 Tax=Branchiostoma belcheri TaxID=7741 RepID=A0A6P4ZE05_BRABE|nr:PREDICTED: C-type lectin domain family 4 member M-like [Branchiostoma belcheri]
MSSTEEEPSQEPGGRSTGVGHKMAAHQNVNEDYTYGYREAEEVSKAYKEESSSHKKSDGDVYGYKKPEDVSKGFEEKPSSRDYEKPEDVYGYKEPEEVRFSYKPKVPRCKKGYRLLAGTCIKLVSTGWYGLGRSHDGAKKACRKEGATLAMPKTEELDVALRDLVKTEGPNKGHWIGMEEKEGTWYWVDGSLVGQNGYKGWNPGQPSNPRWPPTCGQYWEKSKSPDWLFSQSGHPMWDDDACFSLKSFICQRPPA